VKVTVHTEAVAIIEATPSGIASLTFTEAPRDDNDDLYFTVELPGTSDDDPPVSGSQGEVSGMIEELIEKKKFGDQVLTRFNEVVALITSQPIPEVVVERQQLADEATRRRNTRRTWLIEQIEQGSFAAIEMLKNEFGESVKIHVEVTSGAA